MVLIFQALKEDIFNAFRDSIKDQGEEQIESENDKNSLSRQATETKINPSQNGNTPVLNEANESKIDNKKTNQKSPRKKPKLTKTMPSYHSLFCAIISKQCIDGSTIF